MSFCFQFIFNFCHAPHIICVKTLIAKAEMQTACENVVSIANTIMSAPKAMNHAFCTSLQQLACIAI